MTVVVNTRDTPYVIDDQGRIIAGLDRDDIPHTDRVAAGIKSGQLIVLEDTAPTTPVEESE